MTDSFICLSQQDSFASPFPVKSGREVLPEKMVESKVDQGFSPGRVRGSGGWRGWREGMGDFPDIAGLCAAVGGRVPPLGMRKIRTTDEHG